MEQTLNEQEGKVMNISCHSVNLYFEFIKHR